MLYVVSKERIYSCLLSKRVFEVALGSDPPSGICPTRRRPILSMFLFRCGFLAYPSLIWSNCMSQEVNNPMLQMVHNLELKWRSYSHWKPITPSWRQILHGCEISLELRKWCPFAAKFRSPLARTVAVFSWSFPIFVTDILRYFALDIWCLNPQTLLVTHLS